MATIRQKLAIIKRKLPRRLVRIGFRYRNPVDLKSTSKRIYWYVMTFSDRHGESVREQQFRRAVQRTPTQWAQWLASRGHIILVQHILPATNEKTGDNWIFTRNLGFSFQPAFDRVANDGIQRPARKKKQLRNKPSKKRKATKRVCNRRR